MNTPTKALLAAALVFGGFSIGGQALAGECRGDENSANCDLDGDGIRNKDDDDIDGDGVANDEDVCPRDATDSCETDPGPGTDPDPVQAILDLLPPIPPDGLPPVPPDGLPPVPPDGLPPVPPDGLPPVPPDGLPPVPLA